MSLVLSFDTLNAFGEEATSKGRIIPYQGIRLLESGKESTASYEDIMKGDSIVAYHPDIYQKTRKSMYVEVGDLKKAERFLSLVRETIPEAKTYMVNLKSLEGRVLDGLGNKELANMSGDPFSFLSIVGYQNGNIIWGHLGSVPNEINEGKVLEKMKTRFRK